MYAKGILQVGCSVMTGRHVAERRDDMRDMASRGAGVETEVGELVVTVI